jgi:hypothetical protein
MAFRVGLFNFSKGCLSEEIQGRQDVAAYNAGMRRCVNAYILKTGGVMGRPGSRMVYETATPDVRLIPFEVSQDQTYMMLFEQASMKPMYLGGMVLEEELVITGITRANPAVVSAAFHGFVGGEEVFINGQAGMTQINGRTVTVLASLTAGSFSIDLDTTAFSPWSGNTGGIVHGAPPVPPTPPPVPPPAPDPVPPEVAPSVGGGTDSGTLFDPVDSIDWSTFVWF